MKILTALKRIDKIKYIPGVTLKGRQPFDFHNHLDSSSMCCILFSIKSDAICSVASKSYVASRFSLRAGCMHAYGKALTKRVRHWAHHI